MANEGNSGIRTRDTNGMFVFKTNALNRSAIFPYIYIYLKLRIKNYIISDSITIIKATDCNTALSIYDVYVSNMSNFNESNTLQMFLGE